MECGTGDTTPTALRRILRLLWEIIFPYEVRWGIEEQPSAPHVTAHDFSKQEADVSTGSPRRVGITESKT